MRLDTALQPQVVLVARVDDAADAQPLAREQPVEHRGPGVDARDDRGEALLGGAPPLAQRVARRGDEPERLVLGRGLRLADDERPVLVDDERVRHRAARVDREHARDASAGLSRPLTSDAIGCGHGARNARRERWPAASVVLRRPPRAPRTGADPWPRTGCGAYGSSRRAISCSLSCSCSAASASWRW